MKYTADHNKAELEIRQLDEAMQLIRMELIDADGGECEALLTSISKLQAERDRLCFYIHGTDDDTDREFEKSVREGKDI